MLFDKSLLQQVLASYKSVFVSKQWPEEKYKWIAVKHFQDNWDIDAPDFAAMLKNALAKTGNLLVSVNNFPARMITEFAEVAPEQVRAMFKELFDETMDIWQRVKSFKEKSQPLLDIHGRNAKNHYQGENTIFTYLWLRYPEKYYIYKISELKTVAETLHSNLVFQNGKYEDNIRNFLKLYDAIRLELLKDDELKALLKSQLTDDCYADEALCTLTVDFGFYISRRYGQESNNENDNASWFPTDYTPGFTVEDWVKLLKDLEVFTTSNLEIMARFQDFGGVATCKQLSDQYGESANFYNSGSSYLAKRIHEKTNCPVMAENTENSRWWPILYLGRYNEDKNVSGVYIWKLRPELADALKQIDLSDVKLYADNEKFSGKYYLVSWNPKKGFWFFGYNENEVAVGSEMYDNEEGYYRAIDAIKAGEVVVESWRCLSSKVCHGDKIFMIKLGEAPRGIIAYGIAEGKPYKYNFDDEEKQLVDIKFKHILDYKEKILPQEFLVKNFPLQKWSPQGSGIAIKDEYGEDLEKLWYNFIGQENVKLDNSMMKDLRELLLSSKQIILSGAPGTGKTYLAKQIAQALTGKEENVEFCQFHPSFDYTDFVEGLRPIDKGNGNIGFERKDGIFKAFCKRALKNYQDSQKSQQEIKVERSAQEKIDAFLNEAVEKQVCLKTINGNEFYIREFDDRRIYIEIPGNEVKKDIIAPYAEVQKIISEKLSLTKAGDIKNIFNRVHNRQHDSYVYVICNEIRRQKNIISISGKDKVSCENFVFIIDEINRGDISKIFGELFYAVDPGYRGKDGKVTTQYDNLIDETDLYYGGFYIPPNVYIIGTMNDIDRSVESMDFAIRRRFTWKEIEAKDAVGMWNDTIPEYKDEALAKMTRLNEVIEQTESLSKAFHIGPAYFLKLKEYKGDFQRLWDLHIMPLLKEYLRGTFDTETALENLNAAYFNSADFAAEE